MTTLAILFILIGLGLYGVKEYYQVQLGIIPRKTPQSAINGLAEILSAPEDQDDPGGRILFLGSGYGGGVVALAKRMPAWEIDGIEQNPTPWLLSNLRSIGQNFGNYRFFFGDFMTWPLKNYELIFINQPDNILKRWETSIARRLPPGVLVATLNGRLPRVKPINVIPFEGGNTFYVYEKKTPITAADSTGIEQPYSVEAPNTEFKPVEIPSPLEPELPLEPQQPLPGVPTV